MPQFQVGELGPLSMVEGPVPLTSFYQYGYSHLGKTFADNKSPLISTLACEKGKPWQELSTKTIQPRHGGDRLNL